jgi:hypothetical protein
LPVVAVADLMKGLAEAQVDLEQVQVFLLVQALLIRFQ